METSQQQRRPAIGQLAQTLADTKLDFDAIDIIDMLWLAQFIEPGDFVAQAETPKPTTADQSQTDDSPAAIDDSALSLYPDEPRPTQAPPTPTDSIVPPPIQGTPFSVPAAPALRTGIDLARSLRPLMRKVPSRTRFDLDEDATVTQIAETSVWMPVVQPRPERWLELDFVVESSKTTVIWERAIAELNNLAEYQGAFRAIRTWRLDARSGTVQLFPRWREGLSESQSEGSRLQRPHTHKELVDPTGRRLIWLVTDCTSLLWRQDLIYEVLSDRKSVM